MGKRRWTKEEEQYLEDYWGRLSRQKLAKHLDRTVSSVKWKATAMGLGYKVDCVDGIPIRQLPSIVGASAMSIYKWQYKGLKVKKIGNIVYVNEKDLEKFLIANPHLWDATKSDKTWFIKYKWFPEKLEHDRKTSYCGKKSWTEREDREMTMLKNQGLSYAAIGKRLGRTKKSVAKRYWYITGGKMKVV